MLDLVIHRLVAVTTSRHRIDKYAQAHSVFISTTTRCGHLDTVINTTVHLPALVSSPSWCELSDGQNA